jgi:hypothetical protein
MQIKKASIAAAFCMLLLAAACSDNGSGYDPFADESFFVKQGSGQCGPTSFYMIFKYYGDNTYSGNFREMPGCAEPLLLQEDLDTVDENSGVSKWLGVTNSGINIGDLFNKITNLGDDECLPYYTVDGNTDDSLDANRDELEHIILNFFIRELPVIIHLERANPLFSGHYIVLVGFDPEQELVYFVDPNKNDVDPAIQSVALKKFLNTEWYHSPDYTAWNPIPDAFWDGTWVGFYRNI